MASGQKTTGVCKHCRAPIVLVPFLPDGQWWHEAKPRQFRQLNCVGADTFAEPTDQ